MTLSIKPTPEDSQFVQLLCSRLAKMMQGVFSVGVSSILASQGLDFLPRQQRCHAAFLEVLRYTAIHPGDIATNARLNEKTELLTQQSSDFFERYHHLTDFQTMSYDAIDNAVGQLVESYDTFFATLHEITDLLEITADFHPQKHTARAMATGMADLLKAETSATVSTIATK